MLHAANVNIPFFTDELLDSLLPIAMNSFDQDSYDWAPPGGIGQHFLNEEWVTSALQPFLDDLIIKPRAGVGMLSITGPNTWLHKHSDCECGFDWIRTKLTIPLHPREGFQGLPYYDHDDKATVFPMRWHQPCFIDTVTVHGGFTTNDSVRVHLQFTFDKDIEVMCQAVREGSFLRTMRCWIS